MTTGIATSIVPAIRPPKNAQAMAPPEPGSSQEGVRTWLTVAVVPPICISTINISPVFECMYWSCQWQSRHRCYYRVCHSGCESGPHAIIWACQLEVLQVDWGKVTRTLVMYYSRKALLQWLDVVLQFWVLKIRPCKVVYHVHDKLHCTISSITIYIVYGYTADSTVQLVYCVQLYDNIFCMTTIQRCLLSKVLAKQGDFSPLYTGSTIDLSVHLIVWVDYQSNYLSIY